MSLLAKSTSLSPPKKQTKAKTKTKTKKHTHTHTHALITEKHIHARTPQRISSYPLWPLLHNRWNEDAVTSGDEADRDLVYASASSSANDPAALATRYSRSTSARNRPRVAAVHGRVVEISSIETELDSGSNSGALGHMQGDSDGGGASSGGEAGGGGGLDVVAELGKLKAENEMLRLQLGSESLFD